MTPSTPLVREWMDGFLRRYKALVGPPDWPADKAELALFAMAWVTHLGKLSPKPTEDEADAAIERLTLAPPEFRRQCIPAVVKAIVDMRRERSVPASAPTGPSAAELGAIARSEGCPECTRDGKPTGWARRLFLWHSIPKPFVVDWFCRCPLGRFRKANDPELSRGDGKRKHGDLQASPDLWDGSLSHPTWSARPCGHDLESVPDTDGLWRYLLPGEPAPGPMAPAELAARVFPPSRSESQAPTPSRTR